jgi:hypothetical protein
MTASSKKVDEANLLDLNIHFATVLGIAIGMIGKYYSNTS